MVDKIDKPDPPVLYTVKSPGETKKEKQREERRQEDLPTFKQDKGQSLYEEKFQSGSDLLKTFKVSLENIQALLFRRATPHQGRPTAEADLIWKDGRRTEAVLFLLRNWQDFLVIKKLKPFETIHPSFWNYQTPELELTIRQKSHTSGSYNLRELGKPKERRTKPAGPKTQKGPNRYWTSLGILDFRTEKVKPLILGLYGLGVIGLLILFLFLAGA